MKETQIRRILKQNKPKLLIHCPKCKRENYAIAVASGTCVWCGFSNTEARK